MAPKVSPSSSSPPLSSMHCPLVIILTLPRNRRRLATTLLHLRSHTPLTDILVVHGFDGNLAAQQHNVPPLSIDAFEAMPSLRSQNVKVYRGWPVTDDIQAARVVGSSTNTTSPENAWLQYESRFIKLWNADRLRYADFHCRRLTAGDVGCGIAHARAWDIAAAQPEGRPTIILEDDVALLPGFGDAVTSELAALALAEARWHLIHIHSSKYARRRERPFDTPENYRGSLYVAEHRKLLDAYCVSQSGARILASSGYLSHLFPVDDFIPALYSEHPRLDVMDLPCVRRARDAGFVALTFGDDDALQQGVASNRMVGSDSNRAHLIAGDFGVELGGEDCADAVTRVGHADKISKLPETCIVNIHGASLSPACAAAAAEALKRHSFVVLRLPSDGAVLANPLLHSIVDTEALWTQFFASDDDDGSIKRSCIGRGGRAGEHNELMCHGCGWTKQRLREQYHIVCGAWPAEDATSSSSPYVMPSRAVSEASRVFADCMRDVAIQIVSAITPEAVEQLPPLESDASVLDAFHYFNDSSKSANLTNMSAHTDPGLLTMTSTSFVAGLEVQDASTGAWIPVEALCSPMFDVVVFAADVLGSYGVPVCAHRVTMPTPGKESGERVSVVYELRVS